jgi:putative transposase
MRDAIYLLFHLFTTLAKLLRPGGGRTVIAENLLLKQQRIIHSRSRQRAPNLSTQDRALLGFWSLFLNSRRIARSAILIKPSTLLRFHNALKSRKYRLLYSPGGGRKPGPKGPSKEVINAILAMKRHKPSLRLSSNRPTDQLRTRFGAGQRYSPKNTCNALQARSEQSRPILAHDYRPCKRQPVEPGRRTGRSISV